MRKPSCSMCARLFMVVFFGIFFGVILFALVQKTSIKNNGAKVEAKLEISNKNSCTVSYVYDGKYYSGISIDEPRNKKADGKITVYVDKDHPDKAMITDHLNGFRMFTALFGLLFFGSIGFAVEPLITGKYRRSYIEKCMAVEAEVTDIEPCGRFYRTSFPIQTVTCSISNEGTDYTFRSLNEASDPNIKIGSKVLVYIKNKAYTRYYVDISCEYSPDNPGGRSRFPNQTVIINGMPVQLQNFRHNHFE